jgi:hypothetical protein
MHERFRSKIFRGVQYQPTRDEVAQILGINLSRQVSANAAKRSIMSVRFDSVRKEVITLLWTRAGRQDGTVREGRNRLGWVLAATPPETGTFRGEDCEWGGGGSTGRFVRLICWKISADGERNPLDQRLTENYLRWHSDPGSAKPPGKADPNERFPLEASLPASTATGSELDGVIS